MVLLSSSLKTKQELSFIYMLDFCGTFPPKSTGCNVENFAQGLLKSDKRRFFKKSYSQEVKEYVAKETADGKTKLWVAGMHVELRYKDLGCPKGSAVSFSDTEPVPLVNITHFCLVLT